MPDKPTVGFVGAGKLAQGLIPALKRAGYPVVAVASRGRANPEAVADAAEVVFLAVPDAAIESVAGSIRWRAGQTAVHCSGAFGLELLAEPARQGAQTGSFHPLQTFPGGEVELAGVTVAIEGADLLADMALALGCQVLRLPEGAKPLYHASGAFAHNFIVTLLQQAVRLWGVFGCSEQEALQALLPLTRAGLANAERVGVSAALTGPIARGDAATVRRHLQALESAAPDLVPLYSQLGLATLPLTHLEGAPKTDLESILRHPEESRKCV